MQLGIKPLPEALAIAKDFDLDLVEVAPMANPPVCRIMDFGKFKFDEAQRAKESRRKTVHVGIKEMKYRPKIGSRRISTPRPDKWPSSSGEGHKVKITIMSRGREVYHPEHGKRILDRIAEQMEGIAKVEAEPKLDNRNMIIVCPRQAGPPGRSVREKAQQRTDKPGANASPEPAADPVAGNGASEAPVSPPAGNGSAPAAGESNGDDEVAASAEEG